MFTLLFLFCPFTVRVACLSPRDVSFWRHVEPPSYCKHWCLCWNSPGSTAGSMPSRWDTCTDDIMYTRTLLNILSNVAASHSCMFPVWSWYSSVVFHVLQNFFYSRKNFMKPTHQEFPHRNFQEEVDFLSQIFPSMSHEKGLFSHFFLYLATTWFHANVSLQENWHWICFWPGSRWCSLLYGTFELWLLVRTHDGRPLNIQYVKSVDM